MDTWRLILNILLTVSLICKGPVKFLCLASKIIQNYHFSFEYAKSYSKRILICSMGIQIWRELLYLHHEGQLCCSRRLYDKIEQLPPYFECTLSNFPDTLNVHRATLGASMMSPEHYKNAPNWESANNIFLSL